MIIFAYFPPPLFIHAYQLNTREGGSLQILTVINRDSVTLSSRHLPLTNLSHIIFERKKKLLGTAWDICFIHEFWEVIELFPTTLMEKKSNMDNTSLFAISNASITPQ